MKNRVVLALGIIAIGLIDGFAKVYALHHFPGEAAAPLAPVLAFAIHKNPGIAFDIPLPLAVVIPLTLVLCWAFGIIAYRRWLTNPAQALSSVAALIGALGNAIDRLVHGFTTDYLIWFKTSAINLSDVLIILGILGLLWYDKRNSPRRET